MDTRIESDSSDLFRTKYQRRVQNILSLETAVSIEWDSGGRRIKRWLMNWVLDAESWSASLFDEQVTKVLNGAGTICNSDRSAFGGGEHRLILAQRFESFFQIACEVAGGQIDDCG